MLMTLLALVALAALAVAGWTARRLSCLEGLASDHDLQLGAISERVGVTGGDVDAYHDRIHPECAETGGR